MYVFHLTDSIFLQHLIQLFDAESGLYSFMQHRFYLYVILLYNILVVVGRACLLHALQ